MSELTTLLHTLLDNGIDYNTIVNNMKGKGRFNGTYLNNVVKTQSNDEFVNSIMNYVNNGYISRKGNKSKPSQTQITNVINNLTALIPQPPPSPAEQQPQPSKATDIVKQYTYSEDTNEIHEKQLPTKSTITNDNTTPIMKKPKKQQQPPPSPAEQQQPPPSPAEQQQPPPSPAEQQLAIDLLGSSMNEQQQTMQNDIDDSERLARDSQREEDYDEFIKTNIDEFNNMIRPMLSQNTSFDFNLLKLTQKHLLVDVLKDVIAAKQSNEPDKIDNAIKHFNDTFITVFKKVAPKMVSSQEFKQEMRDEFNNWFNTVINNGVLVPMSLNTQHGREDYYVMGNKTFDMRELYNNFKQEYNKQYFNKEYTKNLLANQYETKRLQDRNRRHNAYTTLYKNIPLSVAKQHDLIQQFNQANNGGYIRQNDTQAMSLNDDYDSVFIKTHPLNPEILRHG